MSYGDALQRWHDFYVTAGAAAATLVGLLFVGLSLHIREVVSHSDIRSLARVTLTNFFVVLLIALVVLAPMSDAPATAGWLIGVAAVSLGLVFRPAIQGFRVRRSRTIGLGVLISRFGLSALCYVGLGIAGVLFGRQDFDDGLSGLLLVVVFLLLIAVRNTWDLLVTVAERPAAK
ncbi:MAG: hypothetical protein M3P16_00590 [Chloroflexota bacterium]|nr:hypothetical protein [Chloroflexota bacterium]